MIAAYSWPRASLVLATISLPLLGVAVWLLADMGSVKPATVFVFWPTLLVWVSACLGRNDPGPAAYGVSTAAACCVVLNLLVVVELHGRRSGQFPLLGTPFEGEAKVLAQFPLAVTAFVPAAVGWWQRRQDRLSSDDSAD